MTTTKPTAQDQRPTILLANNALCNISSSLNDMRPIEDTTPEWLTQHATHHTGKTKTGWVPLDEIISKVSRETHVMINRTENLDTKEAQPVKDAVTSVQTAIETLHTVCQGGVRAEGLLEIQGKTTSIIPHTVTIGLKREVVDDAGPRQVVCDFLSEHELIAKRHQSLLDTINEKQSEQTDHFTRTMGKLNCLLDNIKKITPMPQQKHDRVTSAAYSPIVTTMRRLEEARLAHIRSGNDKLAKLDLKQNAIASEITLTVREITEKTAYLRDLYKQSYEVRRERPEQQRKMKASLEQIEAEIAENKQKIEPNSEVAKRTRDMSHEVVLTEEVERLREELTKSVEKGKTQYEASHTSTMSTIKEEKEAVEREMSVLRTVYINTLADQTVYYFRQQQMLNVSNDIPLAGDFEDEEEEDQRLLTTNMEQAQILIDSLEKAILSTADEEFSERLKAKVAATARSVAEACVPSDDESNMKNFITALNKLEAARGVQAYWDRVNTPQ
eukprot:TRINITY_DN14527_c1_g1_i1.p1 TRINITY_DN14527_c1_g1~~TRINITY_DN14527_c1_g1_i1.p1  ORF type:complete len:518 (+),score=114.64 TRINITY_DN14527_c1_g1_i1:55-1554(+)